MPLYVIIELKIEIIITFLVYVQNKKNALYKYASKYTSKEAWDNYKKARNQVNINILKSKISFFNQQVSKNKSNSRGMWTALRTVLPSKKNVSTSSNIKELGPDDFNSFFTAVGLILTQKFDTASLPVINIDRPSCSFSFSNITHDSIHNLLVKLPEKREWTYSLLTSTF